MNKHFYGKIAAQNVKKNKNTFVPFLLTSSLMIAIFYMISAITYNISDGDFYGATQIKQILGVGVYVIGIFSIVILFYTNSFIMKRRNKELGLYNILGLEKRHINRIIFYETAIVAGISLLVGILSGVILSRLMFLLLSKMVQLTVKINMGISLSAIGSTLLLFVLAFLGLVFYNSFNILLLKPIELLQSDRTGEKEPKAKWLLALLGVVLLGIGYVIANGFENPLEAINYFFLAVICVIYGTYFLFIAGSITFLKLLKKNKNYYYNQRHFITVSGMIYRMKQNAAGLASICILSTMVLVTISTTVSLYMGLEESLASRYPQEVTTEIICDKSEFPQEELFEETMQKLAKEQEVALVNVKSNINLTMAGAFNHQVLEASHDYMKATFITGMSLEDYNNTYQENLELGEGEIYLYSIQKEHVPGEALTFGDRTYTIKGIVENEEATKEIEMVGNAMFIIVPSSEDMDAIAIGEYEPSITFDYYFDLEGTQEKKQAFVSKCREALHQAGIENVGTVDNVYNGRKDFMGVYGSLMFIGIFIGTVFLIATVMIIYYKQISEGYDDKGRFEILQKVGMSHKEVKKVIHSQIITVFFLPIVIAFLHVAVAFRIICSMLAMFGLMNERLFAGCCVGTGIVFVLFYGIVYGLTSKTYYKIVG